MKTKSVLRSAIAMLLALLMVVSVLSVGASAATEKQIKNVIMMIGDGMGPNHLAWTKSVRQTTLVMDSFPYQGFSKTDSFSGTTDSAAGGTALACGRRTNNKNVGTYSFYLGDAKAVVFNYKNITEVCREMGMKTGVLTSDSNDGATPAAFSSHTTARKNAADITAQQLSSGMDLIWSALDNNVTEQTVSAAGFKYVDDMTDVNNLQAGDRSFGQFTHPQFADGTQTALLSDLTSSAINQLNNEKGFFLMVEGAHIDKYSHNNEEENMMNSLLEFDKAVSNALEFAKQDGHTLVIVTADHETGGITCKDNVYKWTKSGHSSTNVPLRVYGAAGLVENGEAVVNETVIRFAAEQLGGTLPVVTFNKNFFKDFFASVVAAIKGEA